MIFADAKGLVPAAELGLVVIVSRDTCLEPLGDITSTSDPGRLNQGLVAWALTACSGKNANRDASMAPDYADRGAKRDCAGMA
jgi:hypothetical protein